MASELGDFVPQFYCASFGTNDSDAPYTFEAHRRGRGWSYRRRWRDGQTTPWLSTSAAGLGAILDIQRARRYWSRP